MKNQLRGDKPLRAFALSALSLISIICAPALISAAADTRQTQFYGGEILFRFGDGTP
jgi:hypothetical protein